MKFKKQYSLKEIKEEVEFLMLQGEKRINFLELITAIGFDKKDIANFYKWYIGKREYYYPKER